MTAEPLYGGQGGGMGAYLEGVVDAEQIEARQLALSLAVGPTLGLGLTKHLIQTAGTNSVDQQLDLERDCQRIAGRSADYAEGVTAFLEKRKAEFEGK